MVLGVEVIPPLCPACGAKAHAAEQAALRGQLIPAVLQRAGATPRFLAQTLDTHPDAAAVRLARQWLTAYGKGRAGNLWLSGPVGTGKTGIAWGIVRHLAESSVDAWLAIPEPDRDTSPRVPALIVRWADLLADLKAAFDADRRAITRGDIADPSVLLERAKIVAVLALDDLGRERPTPYAIEQLANLVEERYQRAAPVIVTSNYLTTELTDRIGGENLIDGERIISRLSEGARAHRFKTGNRRRRRVR